jgi:hypothetical protein
VTLERPDRQKLGNSSLKMNSRFFEQCRNERTSRQNILLVAVVDGRNFRLFVSKSGRPSRISPAIPPKISIALVVWIVCLDRPNAAQGGRETAFRRHFRPRKSPFSPLSESISKPVNTNLKTNAVLRTYPEDFGLKTTANSVMTALATKPF